MIRKSRILSVFMAVVFFISGCSTLSTISSTQPDISIRIMERPSAPMPVKEDLAVRTFGSYHFIAGKEGEEPIYGVIPLHVNIGYIILDALFFAPIVLLNARGAYPFYEIDCEKKIIRYSDDGQNWHNYEITSEESDYSKIYYNNLNKESSDSGKPVSLTGKKPEMATQEKQKKTVALAPKKDAQPELRKIILRSTPSGSISENYMRNIIVKYDFYDSMINENGSFQSELVDNGNGTVTDNMTDLMWQKDGSRDNMNYSRTQDYIKKINQEKFAGYSDWRLPTSEELASLLRKERRSGLHIDPVFSSRQFDCWSSNIVRATSAHSVTDIWRVSFEAGDVKLMRSCITPCPGQKSSESNWAISGDVFNKQYFVRAVRTLK